MKLTPKDVGALETVAWGTEHFGSLLTNRQCPRSRVLRLVALGLARSVGFVEPCDGDGFRIEGRGEREGFALTDAGAKLLREKYPDVYADLSIDAQG